ncbi:MAG: hypothetical protein D6732_20120 [Methanobacteriota archaeon]|nr:MAG: hypothetical protein D6732_20120 [Euryarchaeota archaeon]
MISQFPNEIGDEWVYLFTDSTCTYCPIKTDTVIVRVVGDTIINGSRQLRIWRYLFPDTVLSNFVEIKDDTVRIYSDLSALWLTEKYVFPLETAKGWKGDFATDTSWVTSIEPVEVPAGRFEKGVVIEERWGAFNDYGFVTTCFVPDVGIVKKRFENIVLGGRTLNRWELIRYKVRQ